MTENDRIILDEIRSQKKEEIAPDAADADFFELFTAEQVLKDLDLSYEEIESGLVGDGGDGGVDSVYTFVNGELVPEDPDYSGFKKNMAMDLVLIQSKMSTGFQETPIERFITMSGDLFDLSREPSEFGEIYNPTLLSRMEVFRNTYRSLSARFPQLEVPCISPPSAFRPQVEVPSIPQRGFERTGERTPHSRTQALLTGTTIQGIWFNRTEEFNARRRGD